MIPCLAAAGVLYTRLCTHPSISQLEQALLPSVRLYFVSTLTSDRSDGEGKNLNLLSSLERAEFLCALLDTL